MAVAATTVWEVRNGGSDTNGGGFVPGSSGTDWSQQTAAQYAVTNAVTNGTTAVTSSTANFGTDVVGNIVYIAGGTASLSGNWYQIISRDSSTQITVDRTITAGTGATLNIGGAFASPGGAAVPLVTGNTVYVKYNATPFTATSATTSVAGGCVALQPGSLYIGYDTTRSAWNTDANRPTFRINSGLSSATLFSIGANGGVRNFILDGQSQTTSRGVNGPTGLIWRCHATNFTTAGFATGVCVGCSATTNSAASFGTTALYCEAYSNTATPFTGALAAHCLAYNNTGASTDGFANVTTAYNCVSYNNGRSGFHTTLSTGVAPQCINCIAESNAGYGFNSAGSGGTYIGMLNCASYNNTSGRSTGTVLDAGAITGSSSFFANAAGGNFALNTTAGAGALARAASYPSAFPAGTTANYLDAGAAQHADPSGGGPPPAQVFGSHLGPLVIG